MKRICVWLLSALLLLGCVKPSPAPQQSPAPAVTIEATAAPTAEPTAAPEQESLAGCYENDSYDTAILTQIGEEYYLAASLYRLTFIEGAVGTRQGDRLVFAAADGNENPLTLSFFGDGDTYTLQVEESTWELLPAGTRVEGLIRTAQEPTAGGPLFVEEPEQTQAPVQGHYVFSPKVCSVYMQEVFGPDMCEAWYNLVDAVMAGEDTFPCKDQHTYDWVMGQFPYRCLPVLEELIDYAEDREHSVKDGVASFTYLVPPEEARQRIEAFGRDMETLLNSVFEDDYSDFEKALTLYIYFSNHYEYDYDAYERMYREFIEDLSALRFFREGKGVCQEISTAYSYLLLLAGVEATTMMGADHQWSYVRLNGQNYHIDPTFVISERDSLAFFLMTDDQRAATGYSKEGYTITSNYAQDHPHPDYKAEDDHFAPLWSTWFGSLDRQTHTLSCPIEESEYGEWSFLDFDYTGY